MSMHRVFHFWIHYLTSVKPFWFYPDLDPEAKGYLLYRNLEIVMNQKKKRKVDKIGGNIISG